MSRKMILLINSNKWTFCLNKTIHWNIKFKVD